MRVFAPTRYASGTLRSGVRCQGVCVALPSDRRGSDRTEIVTGGLPIISEPCGQPSGSVNALRYAPHLMAGHVSQNWNTIWPSLMQMYTKLKELESAYA